MILRARTVLPISQPPIENGAVSILGNRIAAVGDWKKIKSRSGEEVIDLGETILLPGLVNAHCHLGYTDMAGLITRPKNFPDWIKAILALKANWSYADFALSWLRGAKMLLHSGTTTVADIEAVPELLPEVWTSTPLRVFSFLEMTGVKSGRGAAQILREATRKIASTPSTRNSIALSPHSLYSTKPQLLELTATVARDRKLLVTTHVAESREEFEMFVHRRGTMCKWLKTQRDISDCGGVSPVEQIEKCGLLSPRFLAVHVNYLAPGDAERLGKSKSSVVHCPRSHAYFSHDAFPCKELTDAGVNVCLGTDSLASSTQSRSKPAELNMFAEMRTFAEVHPEVPPKEVLKMATVNGAKALGMAGRVGEISKESFADLVSIPFSEDISEAEEFAVHFAKKPSAVFTEGVLAFANKS